jgi:hypothetical protein
MSKMLSKHSGCCENVAAIVKRRALASPLSRGSSVPRETPALLLYASLVVIVLAVTGCSRAAADVPVTAETPADLVPSPTVAAAATTETPVAAMPPSTALPTATGVPLIGTLTLSESECSLELAKSPVSSGMLSIEVVNETANSFVLDSWKLDIFDEGYTYEQLTEYINEERSLRESGQFNPNPPSELGNLRQFEISAAKSKIIRRFYSPGTYAMVCFRIGARVFMELAGPIEVE